MDRWDFTLVFRYFLRKYSGYVPSVPSSPRFSRASSSVARPENCGQCGHVGLLKVCPLIRAESRPSDEITFY